MEEMKLERLKVVERPLEYIVVYSENELDWVAKFDKSWVEAKSWAYHMVEVYNSRLSQSE
ncbi:MULTISPECIES: hypothetical protein [unclassified Paenibacillus]|uniref:hypothetical protein n=1 Tax=unclassified Paenibacillus TaxID=185978 RepID=UPI001AE8106C|nr:MULTISPECIES: hypothetical protein [unclassified Paenibacillus]MBP1155765.1 hypothetical protein [Paenibacillus sp. PvP091]MBP1168849.1 hypothetical protein [Paenibacillus sp. PvR098]MBP2439877.1 hypothetical protein [Paenibacillus sp. PvP052]